MDAVYWCVKVKKVTGNNQCGFTKEKPGLTNLIAFCNGMGWLCGHGRRDGCHFNFSKALKTVSLSVLVAKLRRYSKTTTPWIKGV